MSCTSSSRLHSAETPRRKSSSGHHESPRSKSAHHSRAVTAQSPEQATRPEQSTRPEQATRPPAQQTGVHLQNAQALVKEAEAKLQGKSKYRCGGGGKGPQSALDCYERAVAQYKMAGEWGQAGNVLENMANIMHNTGDPVGCARVYGEAATCYKKFSSSSAISCFLKSAETYQELGKFGNAAKHHETVALIYSKDMKPADNESVLHHLSMAADLYRDDGRRAPRSRCQLEMARLYGLSGQYENAIAMYEDMGYSALESRLLKYCADEYLFRASLCHLCVDCLNCQIAIKKYIDYYPAFALSREYKFIKSLCEEVEQENEEGFDSTMAKYKSLCNLDPWYITILGKIRGHLPTELDSLR